MGDGPQQSQLFHTAQVSCLLFPGQLPELFQTDAPVTSDVPLQISPRRRDYKTSTLKEIRSLAFC